VQSLNHSERADAAVAGGGGGGSTTEGHAPHAATAIETADAGGGGGGASVGGGDTVVHLHERIRTHRLWHNMRLWETLMLEALGVQARAPAASVSSCTRPSVLACD
jgi:hypothetical protein